MAGIPGLSGLSGLGGGLGGLLGKIPVLGGAMAEVAAPIQALASLTPIGAAANAALNVAGGVANGVIDSSKNGSAVIQSSSINF